MTKYFGVPFANSGDKSTVLDPSQPDGTVNFEDGWTVDYSLDQATDPNAKDIPRQGENYLKFVITEALKELQEYGFKVYAADVNYPVGSVTLGSDNNLYQAHIANGPSSTVVDPVADLTGTWGSAIVSFNSIADMRASSLTFFNNQTVKVLGYYTPGDGGGGIFYWDTASTETDDNGSIIKVTSIATGRWKRFIVSEVNALQFGAKPNDAGFDSTAAIQAAIDYAFYNNVKVVLSGGVLYTTGGILVYGIQTESSGNPTNLEFAAGTSLKMTATAGFIIRSWESPTAVISDFFDQMLHGSIHNAIIDMDGKGDVGIMLESTHGWSIEDCFVRNIPSGTYSYTDKYSHENPGSPGLETYPKCGFALKGVSGWAASLRNTLTRCWAWGADAVAPYTGSGIGFWFGTTREFNNQKANHEYLTQCYARYCPVGFDMEEGDNNRLNMPDASECGIGIRNNQSRLQITQCYLEQDTTGIHNLPFIAPASAGYTYPTGLVLGQSGGNYLMIQGYASKASTVTPILDESPDTTMFPEDFLPKYATMSANGGMSNQTIPVSVWTKVEFDKVERDDFSPIIADIVNDRLLVDSNGDGEGQYIVKGQIYWVGATAGRTYQARIYKNGADTFEGATIMPGATDSYEHQIMGEIYLEKNDYIEIFVNTNEAGGSDITANPRTRFHMVKQISKITKPFNR